MSRDEAISSSVRGLRPIGDSPPGSSVNDPRVVVFRRRPRSALVNHLSDADASVWPAVAPEK